MKRIMAAVLLIMMLTVLAVPAHAEETYTVDMSGLTISGRTVNGFGKVTAPEGQDYKGLYLRITVAYTKSDGSTYAELYSVQAYKMFGIPTTSSGDKISMISVVVLDTDSLDPDWGGHNFSAPTAIFA